MGGVALAAALAEALIFGLAVGILFVIAIAIIIVVVGNIPEAHTPRRSDPMQALQDPTHPDHVRWTMEVLDSDTDGVIEDWEMDGSVWD